MAATDQPGPTPTDLTVPVDLGVPIDLSVIVCVHNGAARIRRQLDALDAQEWDGTWDVVLVDNRSTDATPTVLADFAAAHPRFRMVRAPARAGLSHARNVGVAHTDARAVAFCDDDDEVAPGWVAAMGAALATHPLVACRLDWSGSDPGPNGDDDDGNAGFGFQTNHTEEVFGYPVAAGVGGWQRWLWQALGGNDESMTDTGEDFDMAIRAHLEHGITPHFEPHAVCHITRRTGMRATFRQARRYGKSSVTLYRRYGAGRVDRTDELRRSLRSWAWIMRHTVDLRIADRRGPWARHAGQRIGRLEQSIRTRTLWL